MSDTLRSLFSGSKQNSGSGGTPASDGSLFGGSPAGGSGTRSRKGGVGDDSQHQEVLPDIIPSATIRVIGIGGGGSNAVKRMIEMKTQGVEFVAVNTDAQALYHNPAGKKLNIGRGTTRGLGAGANPDIGKKAAEESSDEIKMALQGADMVFLTAGLGGGTGSGGVAPIAEMARSMGVLTVAVVTKPFSFEGLRRKKQAEEALESLRGKVDTLIVIPNDKILSLIDKTTPLTEAFQVVDDVLHQGIAGIASLITVHGLINVDFADVRSIVQDAGTALMGIGFGTGDSRAAEAARAAIDSPLLDLSISGAKGILFNICGGPDLSMFEVDEAARIITEAADPEANVIFGAVIDEQFAGTVKCTVIATGFEDAAQSTLLPAGSSVFRSQPKSVRSPHGAIKGSMSQRQGMESGSPEAETLQENAVKYSEDELEVPAFMRKKISTK
ncbi:MAG TPA: cell division protein FtsZ [Candidatus Peribacterales bacterium]|nr:cell division protein FtsZ [Candidatus Peribacterales bacterium]